MDRFLVTNGPDGAASVIVESLADVEVEVCKILYGDYPPSDEHRIEWQQYSEILKDANNWSADDGRSYWFWHESYEDGYIRAQRITDA